MQIDPKVFSKGPVVIFKWQKDMGCPISYVTSNVLETFGYPAGELIYKKTPFSDLVYKEDNSYFLQETKRWEDPDINQISYDDFRLVNGAGEIRWVEVFTYVARTESGVVDHLIGYVRDISEKKKFENELWEAHRSLRQKVKEKTIDLEREVKLHTRSEAAHAAQLAFQQMLIDAIPTPLYFKGRDLKYRLCNRSFANMIGKNPHEIIGMHVEEVASKEDADFVTKKDKLLLTEGGVQQYEFHAFDHRLGEERSYIFHKAALGGQVGNSRGIVGVMLDISDRKKAEEQNDILEKKMQQIQRMETIGKLASSIAHEINTPIQYVGDNLKFLEKSFKDVSAIISNCSELVEYEVKDKEIASLCEKLKDFDFLFLQDEIPASLSQTLSGIEQISSIVSAMNEFSHPVTNKRGLFDINKTVENVITVSKGEWKHFAVIELNLDPSNPQIFGFASEIFQVLLNLIVNASHAIKDKGKEFNNGIIAISTKKQNDMVEISIKDNGAGIKEQDKDNVFRSFFTTKEIGKGTGQGLAISRDIVVKKHQGKIFFETKINEGTTFYVMLPSAKKKNQEGKNEA